MMIMGKIISLTATLITGFLLAGTVAGLSIEGSQPEAFEKYTNNSEEDIEQEIKEKVEISSDPENISIKDEIEQKMKEKTREKKQERMTGDTTKSGSNGFFSSLIGIFG